MKKIILDLTMSLDGFIEGKHKEVDWLIFEEETGQNLSAFADEIDTVCTILKIKHHRSLPNTLHRFAMIFSRLELLTIRLKLSGIVPCTIGMKRKKK